MKPSRWQRAGAEAIGSFALVFAGCGAFIVNAQTGLLMHVGVAITFGLVIMVMISAMGHISGAHFNPAVTTAFALVRRFPWHDVPTYIGGQLVGAITASVTLLWLFGDVADLGATEPTGGIGQSFALELLLTAMLMFVILAVATDTRTVSQTAAVAIGGTVALCALFGGPISGASMNPARSLAPAIVSGFWTAQWIYLVAPLLGGGVGALLYESIRGKEDSSK